MRKECVSAAATITAVADVVFGVLADPVSHAAVDGAGWVSGAVDTDRLKAVGQLFRMAMHHEDHPDRDYQSTLRAVRERLRPGGRVVLGDTFWEQPPSQAAQDALEAGPEDFPDLAGLVGRARQHGFEVLDGHVSTLEEWDDYEWAWTGALVRWATRHPSAQEEDRSAALQAAQEHRDAWLHGYRRYLGFVTLVLLDLGAA